MFGTNDLEINHKEEASETEDDLDSGVGDSVPPSPLDEVFPTLDVDNSFIKDNKNFKEEIGLLKSSNVKSKFCLNLAQFYLLVR